jgi:integrase/recombinase XerD
MRVQRVVMPGSGLESWTVLGADHVLLEPVERFLSYLASVERSPNTVKAYAHDLKDWFTFLGVQGLDWRSATVEDVATFVGWLRLPPTARDGQVSVLPTVKHHCSGVSVNRKLAALTSFCGFHTRLGVPLATSLVMMTATGRRGAGTSYRPFLQHISNGTPQRRRAIKLPAPVSRPQASPRLRRKRSWTPVSTCGTGCCSPCCWTRGCGSGRPSGRGTRTSTSPNGTSR